MRELLDELKRQSGEHILFVGTTIFSAGLHFIYSIYVKAYVAPLEYGIYSTCLLLQTYMAYLQLGSLNAFNRDYPQLIGAKKVDEAKKYRNTVFSFILSIYILSFVLVTAVLVVLKHLKPLDSRLVYGFILTALISLLTIIENYGNYRCKMEYGFKYPSVVSILELLSIPIGIVLVPHLGYYGIYITSIITMIIGLVFYYKPSFKDFRFSINCSLLKIILVSGAPLLINGLIWTVVNSIDKFVILGFLDTEALGIYGIAQNAFSYMVLIPTAMSQLFYVKMGKQYGASGKIEVLTCTALRFSTVLAAITSLIALVAFYFLPLLVEIFMPNYLKGVPAAQILIIGLSIYSATLVNGNILTILKQNTLLLINSICMCVFNIICSITFIYFWGFKIENVALGTSASYLLCTLITIYQVYKCSKCDIYSQFFASVLPVMISLTPGVIIYILCRDKIIGFLFSTIFVVLFYVIYLKIKLKSSDGDNSKY